MALKIIREKPKGELMKADRRLYLTADRSEVVEEGDPKAAFLFATPGSEISDADAKRYGLKMQKKPEDKAVKKTATKKAK